ncbi:putative nuclease HARBI1 [Dermacentor andersoni]|uniref:putative nuclease HARBI1 n=1 Tax=Dermacentor andersoni TaxID=34620 RepID=UPI003B3B955C
MADDMNGSAGSAKRAALLLLLDSDSSESESSSSDTSDCSDSDSDGETAAYEREFNRMFRIPAKRPKVVGFIEDVVRQYSDDEFRRHFRLSRPVAEKLIADFAASSMYAANKTCMRNVASRFDLSESSVYRILHRVADFLLTLGQSLIKFPADLENLTRSFEKVSGMPDVVGCIDGSYIKIQCPEKKVASTYCNRHHYLSLTLQAVCDDKRRFLDAFIGSSSKMHDSHVFSLSPLSKKISAVCQGSYHLLGDAAYPLREHLLTPYRDYGALTKQQKHFNYKFSATRVLIENAFSTLKKRFRQLMYLELRTIPWLNKFIISCCVLHNLCIEYGDVEPDDDDNEQAPSDVQWQNCSDNHIDKSGEERALRRLGEIKRTKVLAKLL